MKLRHVLERAGFRKKPQRFGSRVDEFDIGAEHPLRFAHWMHPKQKPTVFDSAEIASLRALLPQGSAVIDIGAHTGDTSVLFASAVGQEGRIFAVEPNAYVLNVLKENAGLNPHIAPIEVLPYAAVRSDGPLTFNYSDSGFCNGGNLVAIDEASHDHNYVLNVEGRDVAAILRNERAPWVPRISLIKSDTEGNDAAALAPFTDIVAKHRPYIVVEFYRRMNAEARVELFALLSTTFGYRVYEMRSWTHPREREITAVNLMDRDHFDVFCEPA